MKQKYVKKLLSAVLALTLCIQTPMGGTVYAADGGNHIPQEMEISEENGTVEPILQAGTAVIPSGSDAETVKMILADALIANAEEVDSQSLDWEYECEGKTKLGIWGNKSFGSINGFETQTGNFIKTTYTHPALAENGDGDYMVRLAGTDVQVVLTKKAKKDASISLKAGTVKLIYKDDLSIDYDAVRESILKETFVTSIPETAPEELKVEYLAGYNVAGKEVWKDISFKKGSLDLTLHNFADQDKEVVRLTYSGNEEYSAVSNQTTIQVQYRDEAELKLKEKVEVEFAYSGDGTIDYDLTRANIFAAVMESSVPDLTASDVTIEYYAKAATGSAGGIGEAWMPLEGGKKELLTYPAVSKGLQRIRISFTGNKDFAPVSAETTIYIGLLASEINVNPETKVQLTFDENGSVDYQKLRAAIFQAAVTSTTPELAVGDVSIEYYATAASGSLGQIGKDWMPLEGGSKNLLTYPAISEGTHKIRITFAGNESYAPASAELSLTVTGRLVLKEGGSFTYAPDADAMKREIFNNVIDWENSLLPEKETLSIENFTMEYYATAETGSMGNIGKAWMPIEGGKDSLNVLTYPIMGAGEQRVRVTYKGDEQNPAVSTTETVVKVEKAKVKVDVHSTNIYANEELSEDFVTVNSPDRFDIYTIYVGATSNVSMGIYLDLPDKFTESKLIELLNPIVEKITGKTFTKIMQEGVTVGELRKIFSTQELLNLLEKLNIDLGVIGEIMSVLNNMPGILDSVRIGFGTPNHAGLYTATAITENKNYKTGVGVGMLLVKMRASGMKLTWNQQLPGKISASEAATFDFGATLTYDGSAEDVSQGNVKYLYSGFTSKWRIYSSTTTPPTEPGAYVMTVVTLGGDYFAAPITRAFQITK